MNRHETQSQGLWSEQGIRLTGFGAYHPREIRHNVPEAGFGGGNSVDASVLGAISVRSRRVSAEDETIPYMAARAGERAMLDAGLEPSDLDLVVLSNWTTPAYTPDHAPEAAALMGAPRAFAFDVATACVGFVHGAQLAAMYLATTQARRALVTCSEQFSRRVRPGSKGEMLCADAAGAVLLEQEDGGPGLLDSVVYSDGDRADVIAARPPKGWVRSQHDLPEHAVESIVSSCDSIMRRNGITISDVDWVIPHPGTDVVHEKVRAALGVPEEQFVVNFERFGNTSSASVPIVLAEERERGRLRDGDLVLSPAIGAGWYFGALLYRVG